MWRTLISDEDGSELLEVALVFPVFLLISLGLLELLLFVYCYEASTYGSRTAVRYATMHSTTSLVPCNATVLQAIVTSYTAALPASSLTVTPTWTPANAVGSTITIQVTMKYATGFAVGSFSQLSTSTTAQGIILQ